MDRNRDQRGQFANQIPAEDALEVFKEREDQAQPLTANDVKEEMGWSRRTVHNKLEELVEDGRLATRKVGGRARVWWVPVPRSDAPLSLMGLSEAPIPSTSEEVLEHADDAIPGRTREKKLERAEAVLTAYEYLQRKGSATKDELQAHTYDAHPIDSATENQSPEERQWVRYLRNGLRELPGVEPPGSTRGRTWNFIDPDSELAQTLDREVDSWVDDIDITGEGTTAADRQRALIQLAYEYLQDAGEARRSDFEEALPDYTAHFTDFDGFWTYVLREALTEHAPGVGPPEGGSAMFTYIGNE